MRWKDYLFRLGSHHHRYKLLSLFDWIVVGAIFINLLGIAFIVQGQTYCEDKPKILYYHKGQAALVSGPGSEEAANHVVISNVNTEFLACVSSRNVEWTYEGEGEPSKFQESSTVDIQNYDDGSVSYCLTSQITFYNKQSDTELSRHTGMYICREIGNSSNSAAVYLFASRKNSPTFLHSRRTLILPLGPENVTLSFLNGKNEVQDAPANVAIANGEAESGSNRPQVTDKAVVSSHVFTIPCITTYPDVTVKLLKKGKNEGFKLYPGASKFDPKFGFLLNVSQANVENLSEFYGEYKCMSSPRIGNEARSIEEDSGGGNKNVGFEDFVLITLVKPKSFKVFPPVTEVYTSGVLNLTCECEDPIIMKEILPPSAPDIYSYLDEDDYTRDRSDDIIETTEKIEQKSHVANYMESAPAPGSTGEIQCISEKDNKVLHTWNYKIIRKRADKLSGIKFNKREKSFTCKTKLGSAGRLSFVSCRTPSECRINKNCLMKSENCRGYSNSTRAFCERKSHFCGKVFFRGGSGLLRCIGEGIDEIRGFTDEAVTDKGNAAVRMGFGKLKASETALLQLTGITTENDQGQKKFISFTGQNSQDSRIYEGDQLNVTLRMGYYFFLYPVQWALKFHNGSTAQISPDSLSLQVDRLIRTVFASITLPYTAATKFMRVDNANGTSIKNSSGKTETSNETVSEIVELNALIPLRSSVDPSWKTIKLPIFVLGKVGVQQPSIDLESEEVATVGEVEQSLQAQGDLSKGSSKNSTEGEDDLITNEREEDIDEDNEEEEEDVGVIEDLVLSSNQSDSQAKLDEERNESVSHNSLKNFTATDNVSVSSTTFSTTTATLNIISTSPNTNQLSLKEQKADSEGVNPTKEILKETQEDLYFARSDSLVPEKSHNKVSAAASHFGSSSSRNSESEENIPTTTIIPNDLPIENFEF